MGLSKVYRGYVIEQTSNGQWYIRNAPSWTNMNAFSPGPHNGWTVAKHQVDKLIEYTNRGNQQLSGWSTQGSSNSNESYSSSSSSDSDSPIINFVIWALILTPIILYWLK